MTQALGDRAVAAKELLAARSLREGEAQRRPNKPSASMTVWNPRHRFKWVCGPAPTVTSRVHCSRFELTCHSLKWQQEEMRPDVRACPKGAAEGGAATHVVGPLQRGTEAKGREPRARGDRRPDFAEPWSPPKGSARRAAGPVPGLRSGFRELFLTFLFDCRSVTCRSETQLQTLFQSDSAMKVDGRSRVACSRLWQTTSCHDVPADRPSTPCSLRAPASGRAPRSVFSNLKFALPYDDQGSAGMLGAGLHFSEPGYAGVFFSSCASTFTAGHERSLGGC